MSVSRLPWSHGRIGGRLPPPGQWNFYSYWHEMSASPDGRYWGNAFRPANQPNIRKGESGASRPVNRCWIHNTPGRRDGEQAFWINGKLLGHWQGINWRKTDQPRANALTLESYVTDRWTKQNTNTVDFDDVVIGGIRSARGRDSRDVASRSIIPRRLARSAANQRSENLGVLGDASHRAMTPTVLTCETQSASHDLTTPN